MSSRPLLALLAACLVRCRRGGAVPHLQVDEFHRQGWLLHRGALDGAEVAALVERLPALMRRHGRAAFGERAGEKEVRFTFAVHELDAVVAAFVGARAGRLWSAAAQLAGTAELCVLMDRGFSKDPGDHETHWHRDDEAVGLPAAAPGLRTVHAWIPLAAMGKEQGTLRYLLGTHRREYGWWESLLDDALELGDAAWHDGWVLHSAGANSVPGAVRDGLAVSFAYCGAGLGNCSGLAARSEEDPTCQLAAVLFDEGWRSRHRSGENDYAKVLIQEPLAVRAGRFVWRSVFGALGGVFIHWLLAACCCKSSEAGAPPGGAERGLPTSALLGAGERRERSKVETLTYLQILTAPEEVAPQIARYRGSPERTVVFSEQGHVGECGFVAAILLDVFGLDEAGVFRLAGGCEAWRRWLSAAAEGGPACSAAALAAFAAKAVTTEVRRPVRTEQAAAGDGSFAFTCPRCSLEGRWAPNGAGSAVKSRGPQPPLGRWGLAKPRATLDAPPVKVRRT
ncbi:unnamed protein product [Prorocentrum cordatum]|uniref:Uncharacterized protein n=1 Tax=Prorocentrum cordatum TaxID=2364126 RepID=A0ABN9QBV3_9DINO|nr:unnamed protein product [Polarella glacialis]